MGELIYLEDRRARRSPTLDLLPAFFFDVGCPLSYLMAERIERTLGRVQWVPVAAGALRIDRLAMRVDTLRERARDGARSLRLPLVWPDRFPAGAPRALRAAERACELGAGAEFALAATRLAFCGGFDLEEPETLAEAAAAAGIPLHECLAAAGDPGRDLALEASAERLRSCGVRELPAIRVRGRWLQGEHGLTAAAVLLREPGAYHSPLAPVGWSGNTSPLPRENLPVLPV